MHSAVSTGCFRGLSTPVASQNFGNSLRFPTVEVRIRSEGMACGWSGNGAGLSPSTLVFPANYHSSTLYTHLSSGPGV